MGQLSSDLITVRDIRLDNLKRDYSGKTIRFVDSKSVSNKGILLDVTDENIIISKSGSPKPLTTLKSNMSLLILKKGIGYGNRTNRSRRHIRVFGSHAWQIRC